MRHLLAALIIAVPTLALAPPAEAHLTYLAADDPINLWLGRQYSADGYWCCDGQDAFIYDGAYTLNADGSLTIPLEGGGSVRVAPEHVLAFNPLDPNPTGSAVWWHAVGAPEKTYCFALGPLT